MSTESSSGKFPIQGHIAVVLVTLITAVFVMSGGTGYDIPAGATALGVIIGGNSLGCLFAAMKKRELKLLDRITGTFALYGVSVLTAYLIVS